jgi:hypothetical protein
MLCSKEPIRRAMNVFVFIFENGLRLISQIRQLEAELGDPNYELVEPFEIVGDELKPWLIEFTTQNTMPFHSDKLLTMVKPTTKLMVKYEESIKN